ncbi:FAD-dependent oxidoreductase [Lysinibacillus fusiformis]|uniref:FAD-dependent oxidoreductase n=1 Tax=Lysinibacillus fusiformis TaxID=28031 RepID=UPI002D773780|nr:FAD-dependent oxidoreductase [Lysinibacillus fusiformis]WRS98878.1 FAD-dependent oxidoreductase [Lysinibacillus fusiformis]
MKYVIIGGDAAGMSAAMEIYRNVPGAEITTLERGFIYSYGQCGLPYVVDGRISSTKRLIARDVETFRGKYGIDARIGYEVEKVDVEKQIVSGVQASGEVFEISYDKLLIATGADPVVPVKRGVELEGIHTVKTIPQLEDLMADLTTDIEQVTIIGGGYIGLEMAETLHACGKKVRLVQRGSHVAKILDEELAQHVHEEAKKNNVELLLNTDVEAFEGNKRVERVITNNGVLETDLVIVASGIRPNTKFLEGTGIAFAKNGAIIVNRHLETSVENVYAAGDCATHFNIVKERIDYIPLGTTANKQGRLAGLNMSGKFAPFRGIVGTSILKFFNLTIATTGINESHAKELGFDYEAFKLSARHIAGYYPGAQRMYIKVVVRKRDQLLLGAQIVGPAGVDKRIDVFATALYSKMTLPDLLDLDLAYAPPFNGVWDPLQQVARMNGRL